MSPRIITGLSRNKRLHTGGLEAFDLANCSICAMHRKDEVFAVLENPEFAKTFKCVALTSFSLKSELNYREDNGLGLQEIN